LSTPPALRRTKILERLRRDGGVSVAVLADELSVSAITVSRDLERLAEDGLVERVYGGARLVGSNGGVQTGPPPTAWVMRVQQAGGAKQAIAERAVRYVEPGATIFLDASSSALALARELMMTPRNEVTLVTTSPAIAYEIQAGSIHVVVAPGELDQHMRMLTGRWTVEFLSQLNFDVAFVSCAGLTLEQGLTTARRPLADVVNAGRASAERTVGLIDSSKFGRASLMSIAPATDLDVIVTEDLPEDVAEEYRAAGVRLDIAANEESQ
jgi:DeoR/GlpR family transcriptional regulator of sugar metabolism